jgi:hypothetical protein
MRREEQIRVIELLMKRLDDGTTVDAGGLCRNPSDVYCSRDLAAQEWRLQSANEARAARAVSTSVAV